MLPAGRFTVIVVGLLAVCLCCYATGQGMATNKSLHAATSLPTQSSHLMPNKDLMPVESFTRKLKQYYNNVIYDYDNGGSGGCTGTGNLIFCYDGLGFVGVSSTDAGSGTTTDNWFSDSGKQCLRNLLGSNAPTAPGSVPFRLVGYTANNKGVVAIAVQRAGGTIGHMPKDEMNVIYGLPCRGLPWFTAVAACGIMLVIRHAFV